MLDDIRKLISHGELEKALELLATRLPGDAALLQAQYASAKNEFTVNLLNYEEWQRVRSKVNHSVLQLAEKAAADAANPLATQAPPVHAPKVFISYSWDDKAVVQNIHNHLSEAGFRVIIDEADMLPGEPVLEFIQNSIRNCDVVLSVVSARSLMSSWVGQESMAALYAIWLADKHFIPVRLDDVRFDIQFQIAVQKGIQSKLQELEAGLLELKSFPGADTRAFDDDRSKLIDMQTNLGKIMQRLKSVLTLDISGDNFSSSMNKVAEKIRSIKG